MALWINTYESAPKHIGSLTRTHFRAILNGFSRALKRAGLPGGPAASLEIIMFAVVKTGGKQYRVSEGDRLRVETLDAEAGASVELDTVLMVGEGDSVTVGTPVISNASVTAKIIDHGRSKKVKIIKFRRRKHHMKRMGHRQNYTEVEITGIKAG